MLEEYLYFVACDLHVVILGRLASDALVAVGAVQGHIGQAVAHLTLLCGMYLVELIGLDQVVGRDDAAVLDKLCGIVLGFTQ